MMSCERDVVVTKDKIFVDLGDVRSISVLLAWFRSL